VNGIEDIRAQFPILSRTVNGMPLVYLDNAATTQKPKQVIDKLSDYYSLHNANIHRGVHTISREATEMYEDARKKCAVFFNVPDPQQLIFTAGTTDAINIVAQGLSKTFLKKGDEIILTQYEHHSNILPWQLWAGENNGALKVIPLKEDQTLDLEKLPALISERTRVISLAHVSNTLGLISDLKKIQAIIKGKNIVLVIDGAQSAPHMTVDLPALGVDFYTCSSHKMYGPTGTGLLYMSPRWIRELALSRTGGGTIRTVSFEKTEYEEGALRFEPGTPNIAGVIGFGEAIDFITRTGREKIFTHEQWLVGKAHEVLAALPEVTVYGYSKEKAAVISFNVKGVHPFDMGTLLDKSGIAVRTGHHCTQPLMKCLKTEGTVRVSFAVYNTEEEVAFFGEKLKKCISMLL
jgi:cysteine desulfurase / selenocysteine lyase